MARTTIGTVTPAAIAGVLLFDGAGGTTFVAVGVVDDVDEIVLVAVVEITEGAGEGELDMVVEEMVVNSCVGTTPMPRSQYLLNTSIADVFWAGSCVHSVETCFPIMLEYLDEFW